MTFGLVAPRSRKRTLSCRKTLRQCAPQLTHSRSCEASDVQGRAEVQPYTQLSMQEPHTEARPFEFDRLLRAARRWGLLIVAASLIGGLTAFLVSQTLPPEYRATAQLYLTPTSNPTVALQDVVMGQNLARSYVHLATAGSVLAPAMEQVGEDDLKKFRARTQVAHVRDTSVINVSFLDRDAQHAADAANAIADSFIRQSRELISQIQAPTLAQLEEQIKVVQDDVRNLDTQITALRAEIAIRPRPESQAQLASLEASRQSRQQTLAQLLQTRDTIRVNIARAENTVSKWESATAPVDPESPRVGLNTALGGLAAGLIALLAIAAITYVDDRLGDSEEIRARLGIAPLGVIQRSGRPETLAGKLFVRDEPASPEAEAVRTLRTNILFAGVDKRPQTILVTSAQPFEGKSVISANLALAFAQAGVPTVLLDADLRRPSQHSLFRVRASIGLTDLLADANLMRSTLERFRVGEHLYLIPSGLLPPNPAELLSSGRMSNLLAGLTRLAEGTTVIIDTSPLLSVADPIALATKVDGCVLVIDGGHTHARAARQAVESLRRVRAVILGAVLNKVSRTEGAYYYQYYPRADADPIPTEARVPASASPTEPEKTSFV
jgi:succinoglycan biosynthesis transport protein ExoP